MKDGDLSEPRRFPSIADIRTDVRRRLTRYFRPSRVVAFEYRAWEGYLLHAMCPDAARVHLTPGERADRLLAALPSAARLAIMHIDLSVTDGFLTHEAELLTGLAARGITILNHRATDIRKRTMHEVCAAQGLPSAAATREGPDDEMVIVKTNLNCAGGPERRVLADGSDSPVAFAREVSDHMRDSGEYRVCPRSNVPTAAWSDPSLVVERFIDNPEGIYYRIYAIGRATLVVEAWSDEKIKKLLGPIRKRVNHFYWNDNGTYVPLGPSNGAAARAATAANELAGAIGAEFHATDCVMDAAGAIIPVDINKTPWWGNQVRPEAIRHLQNGLDDLLGS